MFVYSRKNETHTSDEHAHARPFLFASFGGWDEIVSERVIRIGPRVASAWRHSRRARGRDVQARPPARAAFSSHGCARGRGRSSRWPTNFPRAGRIRGDHASPVSRGEIGCPRHGQWWVPPRSTPQRSLVPWRAGSTRARPLPSLRARRLRGTRNLPRLDRRDSRRSRDSGPETTNRWRHLPLRDRRPRRTLLPRRPLGPRRRRGSREKASTRTPRTSSRRRALPRRIARTTTLGPPEAKMRRMRRKKRLITSGRLATWDRRPAASARGTPSFPCTHRGTTRPPRCGAT